jgi:tetratricopeptide (TPR) repeat protein
MLDGLFKKKAQRGPGSESADQAAGASPPAAAGDKTAGGDGEFKRDTRKAKRFFEHAQSVADLDYAIECFINGLRLDPDNQAMHEALRDVALKRKYSGGKPAGLGEKFKSGGKTPIDKLMHAEGLWAKDPTNIDRIVTVMELAGAADDAIDDVNMATFIEWMGRVFLDASNMKDNRKPNKQTYLRVCQVLEHAECFDQAVEVCRLALEQDPDDAVVVQAVKNLEAERTMKQAQYGKEGADFKSAVKDLAGQRALDQEDRAGSQTQNAVEEEVTRRRAELEEDPQDVVRAEKLVDALRKLGTPAAVEEATRLLLEAWEQSGQYRFKQRAGDIRLRQLAHEDARLLAACKAHAQDAEARKKYDEHHRQRMKIELDEYTDRVENYPTDAGLKFELGRRLEAFKRYEEAIKHFQEAQVDLKLKPKALHGQGRCYLAMGYFEEARQSLERGIAAHKLQDDELGLRMRYDLMDALDKQAQKTRSVEVARQAQEIASFIIQTDIGYRDIRKRLEGLRALAETLQAEAK